ncbi:Precursor of CEP15 [Melia azedarach]|uniref:Precursor of CEP15 n=1 Tax=Melia azedarach TaxID=155640 RepID=A0ACC1Y9Y1_MELAZ|nr:Precursor of CEP15 [Melia azedarach]
MARKNLKGTTLVLVALFLLSLMFQCKVAIRFGNSFAAPAACHFGESSSAGKRKLVVDVGNDYDSGNQAPPQDDGDFYRRQGDVPSPGVGH